MLNLEENGLIYLDNAATSWPKPAAVYQAVDECLRNIGGSPGRGGHSMARAAGTVLFEAREELAALFSVRDSTSISFACNATDGLNTAIFGYMRPGDTVVTTSMEHNAVARPLRYLETRGVKLRVIPCGVDGQLPLARLAEAVADKPRAVVMCHASNVTGMMMPVEAVKRLLAPETAMILDAAQTAGVETVDVEALGVDMLVASGHKGLLGPQGTACLYVKPGISLRPFRFGGTGSLSESDVQPAFMPDMLESGTPNTPGIAGLKAGVQFIRATGLKHIREKEKALAAALVDGCRQIPGISVYGWSDAARQTAVVSMTLRGRDAGQVAHRLSEEFGIACRAGLHCAPWAHRTIGTLKTGTIRLSPGFFNTETEMETVIQALEQVMREER